MINEIKYSVLAVLATALLAALLASPALAEDSGVSIEKARWRADSSKLKLKAKGRIEEADSERAEIRVLDDESGVLLFTSTVKLEDDGKWEFETKRRLDTAPCVVRVVAGGADDRRKVRKAPDDCGVGGQNQLPVADAGADQTIDLPAGAASIQVTLDASASFDADGQLTGYFWTGAPDPQDLRIVQLDLTPGSYQFSLVVADNAGGVSPADSVTVTVNPAPGGGGVPNVSINSTSQNSTDVTANPPVDMAALFKGSEFVALAANDLGMHCADLDYRVFSILPPFNVMHAQVIEKGTPGSPPRLLDDNEMDVAYSAVANPDDPALANPTEGTAFKSNFWDQPDNDGETLGFKTYAPLFFGLLKPGDIAAPDTGLPVPDSILLRDCLTAYLSGGEGPDGPRAKCGLSQQTTPGIADPYVANNAIPFGRFDRDINFFSELLGGLNLGGIIKDVKWWAADGVPMSPVDDAGRSNAYPVLRVQAVSKATGNVVATTDVVTPVASEADCATCHAPKLDCAAVNTGFACNETAISRTAFNLMTLDGDDGGQLPPGDTDLERLSNVAKINVLRVHDAKHGTTLDTSRPVQCSTCHYSPALDLAQLGPTDSPATEQTSHISMSRAMHGFHGALQDDAGAPLFPDMPDPVGRDRATAQSVLGETCYACHPGKRTQCLRGAMAKGGVVCQDCHGDMRHVGNDFSGQFANTPWPDGANLNKRIPWASEPACQSCHTGDAMDSLAGSVDAPVADDGIRLLKAYIVKQGLDPMGLPDATEVAVHFKPTNQRFAENESLYRVSKGHGGVMCEGCHGSTHAIFPNPLPFANDNLASRQLQGHSGTIIECDTCHAPGSLGVTLDGPHGMHPVGDARWNEKHEDIAEHNLGACQACHGRTGEGTVLSRVATDRLLKCKDSRGALCSREDEQISVPAGALIGCGDCHRNYIIAGED